MSDVNIADLNQFLTKAEIKKAKQIIEAVADYDAAKQLEAQIFTPAVMSRINVKLGQENHAGYMSYLTYAAIKRIINVRTD